MTNITKAIILIIGLLLILAAGVFYVAMVVSGKQDDQWPDDMDKNGGAL